MPRGSVVAEAWPTEISAVGKPAQRRVRKRKPMQATSAEPGDGKKEPKARRPRSVQRWESVQQGREAKRLLGKVEREKRKGEVAGQCK